MEHPSKPRFYLKKSTWLCLVFISVLHPAVAQNASKNQILQNMSDQQDVRLHASAVANQIQFLIDELAANGISGEDAKVLQATKVALANLSGPEMDRVIASLQKAGDATNATTTQTQAFNAYASQKEIILQFQQILKKYEQRQASYELPVKFKELRDRETEAMQTTVDVARKTAGRNYSELTTMDQTTQQILQLDQDSIGNDVNLAAGMLEKAAQDGGDDAAPLQKALKDLKEGKLQQALTQANDSLKSGQLLKAINEQKMARDELHRITQDLNPPANIVDALATPAEALGKLIDDQKNLLERTNTAIKDNVEVAGLNDKQGGLVDGANTLQQDMQALSATAATLVKDSIAPMQTSRGQLFHLGGFGNAAKAQQLAIAKLEDAQKELQHQMADAQAATENADKSSDKLLDNIEKQIQQAIQQQKQINNQTGLALNLPAASNATPLNQAQHNQINLQQLVANLQQAVLPLSLPASQDLATATNQMNVAQQNLGTPAQAASAPTAQKAALDALLAADKDLAKQMAQDQQAAADPAALAAAANDLQKAQSDLSSALADSATPSSSSPSDPSSPSPSSPSDSPAPSMDQAAQALAQAAQDANAAANTPGLPDAAAAAVKDAQADIAKGEQAAAQKDAAGTAAQAAAAQQALAQAQASVAMAQAGLPSPTPGTPAPGTPTMAKAPPGPDQASKEGAKTTTGGSTDKGNMHGSPAGSGKFITVTSRDRIALEQSQTEKRPQEYAPQIDQYMKNLADQSTSSLQ